MTDSLRHSFTPRHGRSMLIVLVAILIVGVAALGWLWMRPSSQPNVAAGRSVAETFLRELAEGGADQAWQSTTAEFKSAQGKESFARDVKSLKFLKEPLEFVSVQTVTVGTQPRTEYLFRSSGGNTVRIVLNRENGHWKVDRWTH